MSAGWMGGAVELLGYLSASLAWVLGAQAGLVWQGVGPATAYLPALLTRAHAPTRMQVRGHTLTLRPDAQEAQRALGRLRTSLAARLVLGRLNRASAAH